MTRGQLLDFLTAVAKQYRTDCKASLVRNNHMNKLKVEDVRPLTQEQIDAILVDFINLVGVKQCVDYALYTKDLK